uniref:Transmembrane protein 238 like n=1 Tax=Oryzias latipes TaxID=8090 RepID=A0A3P9L794_ORYLA
LRCSGYTIIFLSIAVFLDVVGLLLLFIGIFAPLRYWDFFVLSGPLLMFLSLVFWIFWYMGNITVSEEELNLVSVPRFCRNLSCQDVFASCCDSIFKLQHNFAHFWVFK